MVSRPSEQSDSAVAEILTGLPSDERCFLLDPDEECLQSVVTVLRERDADATPALDVLVQKEVLWDLRQDFYVASRAASLVTANRLACRRLRDGGHSTLFLAPEAGATLLSVDALATAATPTVGPFFGDVYDRCRDWWTDARSTSFRTPGIDAVRRTMAEDLTESVQTDFDDLLAVAGWRDEMASLDIANAVLLLAAKHGLCNADLVQWAEAVGVVSDGTLSARRKRFERFDIVETEPADDPRTFHLTLTDDYESATTPEELCHLIDRVGTP